MTLDEAINRAEMVVREKRFAAAAWELRRCSKIANEYLECAKEHEQLADWLKDYKRLKGEEE